MPKQRPGDVRGVDGAVVMWSAVTMPRVGWTASPGREPGPKKTSCTASAWSTTPGDNCGAPLGTHRKSQWVDLGDGRAAGQGHHELVGGP